MDTKTLSAYEKNKPAIYIYYILYTNGERLTKKNIVTFVIRLKLYTIKKIKTELANTKKRLGKF